MQSKARRSMHRWAFVFCAAWTACARERETIVPEPVASRTTPSTSEAPAPTPVAAACDGWPATRPATFRVVLRRSLMPLGQLKFDAVRESVEIVGPGPSCSGDYPCRVAPSKDADALYARIRGEDLIAIRDAERTLHDPHIWHGDVTFSFDDERCVLADPWSIGDRAIFASFGRIQDAIVAAAPAPIPAPSAAKK